MSNENIRNDSSVGGIQGTTELEAITIGPGRGAQDVVSKIRNYQTASQNKVLKFPEDHVKYFFEMRYAEYSRNFNLLKVNFVPKGTIFLPLPAQGMVDSHEVDYEEKELGALGTAIQASKNISDGASTLENIGAGIIKVLGQAANSLTGQNVTEAAQALSGLSPNNFLTILLKGPRYKRHEFTWKLYPRNRNEAATINKIIVEMNNKMAPGLAIGGQLFKFPYVFWCGYRPSAKYLYKMKPSVLESFTVNYVPNGVPSFYHDNVPGGDRENPPESIEMKARFVELEFWLRGQFNEEHDAENSRQLNNEKLFNSNPAGSELYGPPEDGVPRERRDEEELIPTPNGGIVRRRRRTT